MPDQWHRSIPHDSTTSLDCSCHTDGQLMTAQDDLLCTASRRLRGGQHKCCKDALKTNLTVLDINSTDLVETLAASLRRIA